MAPVNSTSAAEYEKLGAFYLGRRYDRATRKASGEDILYDAKDLTTHAVCIGMTGSGKTGLCTCLLEEAAIDGIPAIIIDPKGDMGNLLLSFPELNPADFEPWVDPAEAERKGLSVSDYAKSRAELWRSGLGDWGQDGARIQRLHDSADIRLYTPGSSSGTPLSVLRSFAAPGKQIREDGDAFRERIMGTTSGILTLLGIEADPVKSREHILISTILDHFWRQGKDLDIPSLIMNVQKPPVEQIGVLPLESFYPSNERMELVLTINNLLASPSFAAWMQGDPLDVASLLYSPAGKPRLSILYIAHLSDRERMFFVTLLLNEVISWMRQQPGTGSLRALLYMDEVFGYFPPVANPPAKQPMLTLLKQARAYGLGVVLATQNPVDLDYKGLSNAGTWFLGRLQTERDKLRVLDGLEGLAGSGDGALDRQELDALLSALDSRVFLMKNVHEPEPVLFQTRWALSYLRGPLTRLEIQRLTEGVAPDPAAQPAQPEKITSAAAVSSADVQPAGMRPLVATGVEEMFGAPPPGAGAAALYRPGLLGNIRLHYVRSGFDVDEWREFTLYAPLGAEKGADPWAGSQLVDLSDLELSTQAPAGAVFGGLPGDAGTAKTYKDWAAQLKDWAVRNSRMKLYECRKLKLQSGPGESLAEFSARVNQRLREERDGEIEKLRAKYATREDMLGRRIESAEQAVARELSQLSQQKVDTAISIGTTVLGALFGRKALSATRVREAGSVARKAGRTSSGSRDVAQARRRLEEARSEQYDLDLKLQDEVFELRGRYGAENYPVESLELPPRKGDMAVEPLKILWLPQGSAGNS